MEAFAYTRENVERFTYIEEGDDEVENVRGAGGDVAVLCVLGDNEFVVVKGNVSGSNM